MRGVMVAGAVVLGLAPAAAPQVPERTLPEYGVVVDGQTGRPIAGAVIGERGGEWGHRLFWMHEGINGMKSETDGRFSMFFYKPGEEIIAIHPTRGCSAWLKVTAGMKQVVLRVLPGNLLSGVTRDAETKKPVGFVALQFQGGKGGGIRDVISDAKGRYRLTAFPPDCPYRPLIKYWPDLVRRPDDPTLPVVAFTGIGQKQTLDVFVHPRPSVMVTWTLKPPAGKRLPKRLLVVQIMETTDPPRKGARAGGVAGALARGGRYDELVKVEKQQIRRWTHHQRWVELAKRQKTITVKLVQGRNTVRIGAGVLFAAPIVREVTAAGPAESATLELQTRPRVWLKLTGRPATCKTVTGLGCRWWIGRPPHGGVDISNAPDRGGMTEIPGTTCGETDRRGRIDVTDLAHELAAGPGPPKRTRDSVFVGKDSTLLKDEAVIGFSLRDPDDWKVLAGRLLIARAELRKRLAAPESGAVVLDVTPR